jgi:transcription elongation factor Elf1
MGSVECTIDLKHRLAEAVCGICKEAYSTSAHALTEPIDVYSEWIDACE